MEVFNSFYLPLEMKILVRSSYYFYYSRRLMMVKEPFILAYPLCRLVSALNVHFSFTKEIDPKCSFLGPGSEGLFPGLPRGSRMQTVVNPLTITTAYGLPLCATGITHRFDVSQQVSDHEHRRKALKERRSREIPSPESEVGFARLLEKVMKEALGEELGLCYRFTARAA
ncbi:hypothetical protein H6P81_006351 [Aristolochia fimbriata]|uniref:Uncharacterized protein n=1 Tax=Aristolochia fimbriata TaxID=158543 RepID=A0AAV7F0J8_ARIFI|nr:hypothetical protein H6P81_006351 [Aristolochia fimbriata]